MQSGTEFGNKTKEDIRILIRYSELKDFSPVTFNRQYYYYLFDKVMRCSYCGAS